MRNLYCSVCFQPVNYKQNTCGGSDCLDSWRHYSTETRRKRKNLASMSPSEREFVLRAEPEPTPDPDFIENLRADALEEAKSKDKTPSFIRSWLSPENAPIKTELEVNDENGNPLSPNAHNIDSANNK